MASKVLNVLFAPYFLHIIKPALNNISPIRKIIVLTYTFLLLCCPLSLHTVLAMFTSSLNCVSIPCLVLYLFMFLYLSLFITVLFFFIS